MLNTKVKSERPVKMDIMQYEVNITEDQLWVYARVYEPMTKALALDLLKEAVGQVTRHGVCSLLVDARGAPSMKTTVEDFEVANYDLLELGFERRFKSAIVVDAEDKTHDFFETCMMNAGYICRIFSDVDLAAQWLDSVRRAK